MRIHFAIATLFLTSIPTQKNPNIPQVGNAETDETGFGGFVTMLLGVFCEIAQNQSADISVSLTHTTPASRRQHCQFNQVTGYWHQSGNLWRSLSRV